MIQRIQSLWLFIASMLNGLLFIFPLYRYNYPGLIYSPWQMESVRTYIPLFITAAVITVLPLIAVFLFKDRKQQKGLVWLSIIFIFAFIALVLMRVSNLKHGAAPVANFQYVVPGVLVTVGALVMEILALRGIRKDERLIKSLDRLR